MPVPDISPERMKLIAIFSDLNNLRQEHQMTPVADVEKLNQTVADLMGIADRLATVVTDLAVQADQ